MSGIHILLSDSHGIYLPQGFVEKFDMSDWHGVSAEDHEILSAGPEHEFYWDAWENILNTASHIDEDGMQWKLWQDGDLFAICEDRMTAEEYKNFFGEEKEVACVILKSN